MGLKSPRADYALDPITRNDARRAVLLLEGTGLSLFEAAQAAITARAGKETRRTKKPIEEAIRAFIADTHSRGRRGGTLEFYEKNLAAFAADEIGARWQTATRRELEQWLLDLGVGQTMQGMTYRALRAFYRFARRQDPPWCGVPPTEGMRPGRPGEAPEIEFYRVAVVDGWLRRARPEDRAALAVQLFAGLRPEEVAPQWTDKGRAEWEHFDMAGHIVRVPAAVSKTRRPRVIEGLPDALWNWLAETPEAKRRGPIWTGRADWMRTRHREALGSATPWIARGPRKTFATHAVALTGDPAKVALWLGHEGVPTMLHRHYRGLVTQAEGRAFFGLSP